MLSSEAADMLVHTLIQHETLGPQGLLLHDCSH